MEYERHRKEVQINASFVYVGECVWRGGRGAVRGECVRPWRGRRGQ